MEQQKENLRNHVSANPEKTLSVDKVEVGDVLSTEQVRSVVANVSENAAEDNKTFSEKGKIVSSGNGAVGTSTIANIGASSAPSIEVMIKETVEAVRKELKRNEAEMKSMLRNKRIPYYQINDKAKKIRFLNGVLVQLKRAAKLAEEFVIGLWKQYVKKI